MRTAPPTRRRLTGWGRTAPTVAEVHTPTGPEEAACALLGGGERGVVARGLGRSYGDAAQNAGGTVLDMTQLACVHAVDRERRTAVVDAGVSFDSLERALLPFELGLPVVPGTRQVTVGGAIAADVHGKNHHVAGSFGQHVGSLELLLADGSCRTVRPDDPATQRLFWATVGGMGLTGVVLRATLLLEPRRTSYVVVDTERASDLQDLMDRLAARDDEYPYSVAWFDTARTGRHLGRGVIMRGRQASVDDLPPRRRAAARRPPGSTRVTVPSLVPPGALNGLTGRAFNEVWYRKAPADRRGEVQSAAQFFHPLDALAEWNRLYGPRGLCQYQFVVPDGAEAAFHACVADIARSSHVSALSVLKRFGPGNRSPLSFPQAGWTLAVDFPVRSGLETLLDRLDAQVLEAGGRVYLAKDARTAPTTVARMYPRLEEFREVRREVDPLGRFQSDLSRRLGL